MFGLRSCSRVLSLCVSTRICSVPRTGGYPLQIRYFGITDYLRGEQDKAKLQELERAQLHFENMVRTMIAMEEYTISDFLRSNKDTLKENDGTMRKAMNLVSGKPEEIKDLESIIATLEAFNEEEKSAVNTDMFDFQRKKIMMLRSRGKITTEGLYTALERFEAASKMHVYLRRLNANKEELPKTHGDLMKMMREDRRVMNIYKKRSSRRSRFY